MWGKAFSPSVYTAPARRAFTGFLPPENDGLHIYAAATLSFGRSSIESFDISRRNTA
jgi:hypothetical protein